MEFIEVLIRQLKINGRRRPGMERLSKPTSPGLQVYTDGAIYPERGLSGLAAIVRDEQGQIRYWWTEKAGTMTCNEAEYAAAVMALERLRIVKPSRVVVYSDSRVMVEQMQGVAQVKSVNLRAPHARLRQLVAEFPQVRFQHIPREKNQLADALAYEAITACAKGQSE
jgi:ribonuclease HI